MAADFSGAYVNRDLLRPLEQRGTVRSGARTRPPGERWRDQRRYSVIE